MGKKLLSIILMLSLLSVTIPINAYATTEVYESSGDEIKKCCLEGKINVGIKCSEEDIVSFVCDDDNGFNYYRIGSMYTTFSGNVNRYSFEFTSAGDKNVAVYINNYYEGIIKCYVYGSHEWDKGKVTKEATDIKEGEKTYTCLNCGETKTEIIEKTEHTYEVFSQKNATCTSDGYIKYKCKNCGDTYEEKIKSLGHDYIVDKVVNPTCKAKGYTEYKCSRCSSTKKDNETKIINHDYKEVSRTDATCTKKGEIKYKCSMCNGTKTETLQIIPHHYVAIKTISATCKEKGYTEYKCDICNKETYKGDFIEAVGHNYGEWETTEPTALKDGKKERTCITCGAKEEELLESLEPFIKVSKNKIKIKHGKTYKIKNVKLAYGDKITHYETSKKKIATVNKNGKIKAKRKGETRITIVAKSGIEKDIRVVVK